MTISANSLSKGSKGKSHPVVACAPCRKARKQKFSLIGKMDSSFIEDGEPKVGINPGNSTRQTFDTIAFTVPKKETIPATPTLFTPLPMDPYISIPTATMSKTNSMISMVADDLQSGDPTGISSGNLVGGQAYEYSEFPVVSSRGDTQNKSVTTAHVAICVDDDEIIQPSATISGIPVDGNHIVSALEGLNLNTDHYSEHSLIQPVVFHDPPFFSDNTPDVPYNYRSQVEFPTIGMALEAKGDTTESTFAWKEYIDDSSSQVWIPIEETKKVLHSISSEVAAGTHVPDKEDMTMPGIILTEDLVDKVELNVRKMFGSPETMRRKTFTADNVTQDDNGLRELIKLGCYRAAINLTKRLLILYGQGPGKIGHYSKHTPHSLQVWFLRITLLVRIREFATAEAELEAFKGFEKPDMYYDYYSDGGKFSKMTGKSIVPFHFRVLAAEVPQYMRKFNDSINKLYDILYRVEQILGTLDNSLDMDTKSVWKKREIRVLYSLANSSLFAKDYHNAFNFLTQLCEKDEGHLPQLKSSLGRLFLQHGDISTAETYFQSASELRSDSELDQVDSLVDSALLAISQNQYAEAAEFLKQALILQPENFMISNNLAVCHLYLGNVKESLALMETTVKQNMPQSLQENVILNLCSVYELENSDGSKKLGLLKLISEYKGDGINLASLKLADLI